MKRRLVRVLIRTELWQQMCTKGWCIKEGIECVEGLPPGAEWVGSDSDADKMLINLVFTHPSFDEVESGTIIPTLGVTFQTCSKTEVA